MSVAHHPSYDSKGRVAMYCIVLYMGAVYGNVCKLFGSFFTFFNFYCLDLHNTKHVLHQQMYDETYAEISLKIRPPLL